MEVTTDELNAAPLPETLTAALLVDGVVTTEERKIEPENRGDRKSPPEDEVCPICFGSFTVPCRGNCCHWYCGSCILEYWNYAAVVSTPCKCPMCLEHITKLSPEASLQQSQEQEVKEVLAKIRRYNSLFLTGFVQMCMSVLYSAAEFNRIPTGGFKILNGFDYAAFAIIMILQLVW